jgi:peptidoglycan/LPS O-acetylase OafA/YrhL
MGSLRFLLALAVTGGHTVSMFGFSAAWILPGSRAVQIFYIISGFLMAMILNGKYADTREGNWTFYSNRVVKIFAPYFIILAITIAICLLSRLFTGDAIFLQMWFDEAGTMSFSTWAYVLLTNILIVGQEWGFLLIYRGGQLFYSLQAFYEPPMGAQFTIIAPAWTLSLELLFYALAPFLLRRHLLIVIAVAYASYRLRFEAGGAGYSSEALEYRFFPFELSLFLYGAICFRIGRLLPTANFVIIIAVTSAVILTIAFLPQYLIERQHRLYFWLGLLLSLLFEFSRRVRWDRQLGELSYPLYLLHWPVAGTLAHLTAGVRSSSIAYPIVAVATAIVAAILINRYIVAPVDRWRQLRVTGERRLESAQVPSFADVLPMMPQDDGEFPRRNHT